MQGGGKWLHMLWCQWCGRQVTWGVAATVCLVLSLPFSASGLGSVCAHLHGCVLLSCLALCLCEGTAPKAGLGCVCPSSWGRLSMPPCALVCYRVCSNADMFLGILCAPFLVYLSLCVSWPGLRYHMVCVGVTEPVQAAMSCPSSALVK